jgi:hypothetical protein
MATVCGHIASTISGVASSAIGVSGLGVVEGVRSAAGGMLSEFRRGAGRGLQGEFCVQGGLIVCSWPLWFVILIVGS